MSASRIARRTKKLKRLVNGIDDDMLLAEYERNATWAAALVEGFKSEEVTDHSEAEYLRGMYEGRLAVWLELRDGLRKAITERHAGVRRRP